MAKANNQKITLLQLKLSEWMKWEAIWSLIFFPSEMKNQTCCSKKPNVVEYVLLLCNFQEIEKVFVTPVSCSVHY